MIRAARLAGILLGLGLASANAATEAPPAPGKSRVAAPATASDKDAKLAASAPREARATTAAKPSTPRKATPRSGVQTVPTEQLGLGCSSAE